MNKFLDLDIVATGLFIVALAHTFLCPLLYRIGNRYPSGTVMENLFHLVGEVEIVFGFWSAVLIIVFSIFRNAEYTFQFVDSLSFQEPLFVFVIMVISATQPIILFAEKIIETFGIFVPNQIRTPVLYFLTLTLGPLLGSLITEPAAMTVTALLLKKRFCSKKSSINFKYIALSVLFVNISIGGTLTPFAAPPIVMVARIFNWDLSHMWTQFGFRAVGAVFLNSLGATLCSYFFRKNEEREVHIEITQAQIKKMPIWITLSHILFLTAVILLNHHVVLFVGIFLFFIGFVHVTEEFQTSLQLRSSLLVGFFLAGIVVLGAPQVWWLSPFIQSLSEKGLYFGATLLTAITDNAALTYLGSKVPNLSESARYYLVAGAVTGGGLTVIANAPNPIGYSLLRPIFGEQGVQHLKLFFYALPPTLIAVLFFCWL